MNVYMFTVGGASASGKSLMAECIKYFLSPYIPVFLMRQDRFYKPCSEIEIHPEYLEQNWEIPSALDMNAFQNTITYILQARSVKELEKLWLEKELHLDGQIHVPDTNDTSLPDWICTDTLRPMLHSLLSKLASSKAVVVLLDGFLLHYEPSVCMNMHGNIFLSCSYETCQYRRSLRSGYLSNDGQVWSDPPNYFENLVWPSYLCLNDRILSNSTICQSMESCFKHFPSERINLDGQEILILDSNDFGMEGIISNLQIALSFISERIMMANYDDGDRVI